MRIGQDFAIGPTKPYISSRPFAAPPARPVVAINPPATQLAQDGALRPAAGPWSASNPQPMTDGAGNVMRPSVTNPITQAASGTAPPPATAPGRTPPAQTPSSSGTPAATFGGTRSGGATSAPQAASVNGRPLGYGAMVNGVRTFSDGSGGPGAPAATMTRPQIDALSVGRGLSRADAGIGGGIGSAAAGGTPELGAFNGRIDQVPRPVAQPYDRARGDNIEAQRMAASDAASIARGDTRSVLGSAARAAAIDANSSFGTRASRKQGYASAMEALNGAAAAGLRPQADLGITGLNDAGATAREGMQQQGENQRNAVNAQTQLAGDYLRRPTPSQIDLADGTIGLLGADGPVRPALGADGQPVRRAQPRSVEESTAHEKLVNENVKALLGMDENGTMPDPADPRKRVPVTAEQFQNATAAMREALARGNAAPASAGPPPEAAQFLQQNPQYREQFDKKYGAGASARLLGKQA